MSATTKYDDDFIPGTVNLVPAEVLDSESGKNFSDGNKIKTSNGIILMPQPSDSPNDPLNWGFWRKLAHFVVVIFITGFTSATANDAGATQDSLNQLYGISYASMNTGAGVLFLGIAFASLILAPSASIWGRKCSYIISMVMGLIGSIWFGYLKNTSDTIWSQLFVGISEACAETLVQLSIADIYFQHQLGLRLTIYILSTSVGTYLGPLIAGFIGAAGDNAFRWVGWIAAIIYGVLIIVFVFFFEESYFDRARMLGQITERNTTSSSPVLPQEEQKKDGKLDDVAVVNNLSAQNSRVSQFSVGEQTPSVYDAGASDPAKSYWQRIQPITPATNIKGVGFKQYLRQIKMIFRVFMFPPVILSGLMWGAQDAFLTFYLTTEDDSYYDAPWNYSNKGVAIMNVPCVIGAAIGCFYAGTFSDWFVIQMAKRNNGIMEAEFRLWFIFLAAIISPAGLLIFGIGTGKGYGWQKTYIGLGFIGFGWGCAGDISMSYLMDAYPEMVIEGMVGVAVINNLIGCVFTFACSPWLDSMGTTNTYIILAVINFLIMMLCLPMIIYGKKCRAWTKNGYLEFLKIRDEI